MPFCPACRAEVPEGLSYCPHCSTPIPGARRAVSHAQPPDCEPEQETYEEAYDDGPQPMGVGATLGSLLVMVLPVLGLIFTIVWACGGTSRPDRRTLARAFLILDIILAVVGFILLVIAAMVLQPYLSSIQSFL